MKNKVGRGFSMGALLSIMCLALVGCGGSSSSDNTGTASVAVVDCSTVTSAATVTATSAVKFNPQNVTISVNNVIRWVSADIQDHTVTSGTASSTTATPDGKFNELLNTNGPPVCLRFNAAGTYNYYCTYHYMVGMTGVVTVQ